MSIYLAQTTETGEGVGDSSVSCSNFSVEKALEWGEAPVETPLFVFCREASQGPLYAVLRENELRLIKLND